MTQGSSPRPSVTALAVALAALAWAPARAQPSPLLPRTPAGWYALGETFARCTARLTFVAIAARQAGLPDAASAAEDGARDWRLAGMYVLANGLAPERQNRTEALFGDLVTAQLNPLKARLDVDGVGAVDRSSAAFSKECGPLAPMQEAILAVMRPRAASG